MYGSTDSWLCDDEPDAAGPDRTTPHAGGETTDASESRGGR
ncbi:hypothetical protein [Halostella litorea]|nr:hypothetical protein [Halostella litorea]